LLKGRNIFFDVATMERAEVSRGDTGSLYARHMGKHLPKISFFASTDDSSHKLPYAFILEFLASWWKGSERGVQFSLRIDKIVIAPSCVRYNFL